MVVDNAEEGAQRSRSGRSQSASSTRRSSSCCSRGDQTSSALGSVGTAHGSKRKTDLGQDQSALFRAVFERGSSDPISEREPSQPGEAIQSPIPRHFLHGADVAAEHIVRSRRPGRRRGRGSVTSRELPGIQPCQPSVLSCSRKRDPEAGSHFSPSAPCLFHQAVCSQLRYPPL